MQNSRYFSLIIWIAALIAMGSLIGWLTKPEMSTWYSTLNRSPLTPPNYVFPIAWTLLYTLIGICGWLIWSNAMPSGLKLIKILYVSQLMLNWSWTPLFFFYHFTLLAFLVLIALDILVGALIWLVYPKIKTVALLMVPYLLWLLFATHLSFYIWQHN